MSRGGRRAVLGAERGPVCLQGGACVSRAACLGALGAVRGSDARLRGLLGGCVVLAGVIRRGNRACELGEDAEFGLFECGGEVGEGLGEGVVSFP